MREEVIKILGTQALFLIALAWLVRTLCVYFLSKDIEMFKMERRKHTLEHEIRFRRVDEKVADTLSELYGLLENLIASIQR